MGTESWRTDSSVEDTLFKEPYRFNFFQAVRMLDWLYPDRASIGHKAHPGQEVVRFHSYPSISFPPSPIYEIEKGEGTDEPVHMIIAFMGLTGPQGVLPRHYTEMVLERLRERDRTLLDFLDLFTHRFVSLFYRSWEKYHIPTAFERGVVKGSGEDVVSQSLYSLIGMGTQGLKERLRFNPTTLLGYAGLIGQHPHSSISLQHMLCDYFKLPVKIEQFIGEWLDLSVENQTHLTSQDGNNALGETAMAGTRVWDQQARFQLRFGPLKLPDFLRMLPSGQAYGSLIQLTRYFTGQELDFDIRLVLQAKEVPACRLQEDQECPPRLGWNTWLKSHEFTQDAEDVVFAGAAG